MQRFERVYRCLACKAEYEHAASARDCCNEEKICMEEISSRCELWTQACAAQDKAAADRAILHDELQRLSARLVDIRNAPKELNHDNT